MSSDQITGIIRAVLAAIGGFVIARWPDQAAMWNWIAGGVLTVIPLVWTIWANRPAGIAGSAQALPGVNVTTTAAAGSSVEAAVLANK